MKIQIKALRHSAFYSPLLMAIAGPYLRDEGLEPEYAPVTPDKTLAASFSDGTCHVAQSAVAASFAQLQKGEQPDLVHFAQINERDGFFIAGRKAEPNFHWQNLRGKRVLVDHFFQPIAMFKYALKRKGMSLSDLVVIDAGDVEAIDRAFRRGEADYVHQQGPAPQQLEKDGVGYVVAAVGDAIGPVAFSSLCAKREWLETDMAKAFMRAYQRSLHYVRNAPAEEIARYELEANYFPNIDRDVLINSISAYQQLGCWQADPHISEQAYEMLLDVFINNGSISRRYPYHAAIAPFSDV